MDETRISISGCSGGIAVELAIIKKALEDYGFEVAVRNDLPKAAAIAGGLFGSDQELLEHVKRHNSRREEPVRVVINMDHSAVKMGA